MARLNDDERRKAMANLATGAGCTDAHALYLTDLADDLLERVSERSRLDAVQFVALSFAKLGAPLPESVRVRGLRHPPALPVDETLEDGS